MENSEANDICQSDLIYVLGPINDKSNCFKLKKLIYLVLHVRLYFDGETIGMDREVINASTHVYGFAFFFFFDPLWNLTYD